MMIYSREDNCDDLFKGRYSRFKEKIIMMIYSREDKNHYLLDNYDHLFSGIYSRLCKGRDKNKANLV